MKKNKYILALLLVVSSVVNIASADIAQFKTVITRIENMLDGIVPLDRAKVEESLQLLERTTEYPSNAADRVARARARFGRYRENNQALRGNVLQQEPKKIPEKKQPQKPKKNVRFKDKHEDIPVPSLKGLSPEQKLETLLLYTKNLAGTADLAIKVHQKNNAHTNAVQANNTVDLMRDLIGQHPELAENFIERVQDVSDRITALQQQVNEMP